MKLLLLVLMAGAFMISCNNKRIPAAENTSSVEITETAAFFPVTSYLKGQIAEIKNNGLNPVRIRTAAGKTDSAWLKVEQLDSVFAEFLTPEIDSVTMAGLFKESKFHDQTLNSFTFTYEPLKALPPGMLLKRWDVYVNPQNGTVKRIYMEKSTADKKELQLSWQSGIGSKITWFSTGASGNQEIEKEELVKWSFDEE